jgi:predicted RNA binding protein YcfA (HicA-like mRNA interferase family)
VVKPRKLLIRLAGGSLANVRFGDFQGLVEAFGFSLKRVSGSHHVFSHPDVPELVNLQYIKGEAKPYQVRHFLRLVERYNLKLEDAP